MSRNTILTLPCLCVAPCSIGGTTGSCTCMCATGYATPSCATCAAGYSGAGCSPDPCVATSTSTDDGTDGNFYCINGGSIGGTTGSCTCSCSHIGFAAPNCAGCATGYSGGSCIPDPCVATSTSTDDGTDGNFYCVNGGTVGGTTGSCTCTGCNANFVGNNCEVRMGKN